MFDSPLEYCPRCREYIALDLTQRQCAAQHLCGNEPCPLERYFTGTKPELEPIAPEHPYDQETHGLSPDATSLLSVIAEREQLAFSGSDLQRLLQKPEAEVEAIVEELKSRRLLRLSYQTDEDRGYELSADGKRYIRNQFQKSVRLM